MTGTNADSARAGTTGDPREGLPIDPRGHSVATSDGSDGPEDCTVTEYRRGLFLDDHARWSRGLNYQHEGIGDD